jgi:protein-disulfide isomerase
MEKPSIGILAGMGLHSTGPFIDMVVSECQRQYGARDDIDFPKWRRTSHKPPAALELIYLDLPLQGPRAFKAAEAAACAGDQDMFWDMHHQLFANQQGLSPDRLAAYAEELGLDAAAFRKCLDSGRHAGGIREDMRAIKVLDINSTPAYLLGRRVPDSDKVEILDVIRGAKPYEELEKKINALLAPAPVAEP